MATKTTKKAKKKTATSKKAAAAKWAALRPETEIHKPTIHDAKRVLKVVDCGLSCGLGEPKPGEMCVEAAVNYALGFEHDDKPNCVDTQLRTFKIAWNDIELWKNNTTRAEGLRRLSIIQLSTVGVLDFESVADRFISNLREFFLDPIFNKFVILNSDAGENVLESIEDWQDEDNLRALAEMTGRTVDDVLFIITELAVQAIIQTHPTLKSVKWMKELTKTPKLKAFQP